jgi:hypothetical protein
MRCESWKDFEGQEGALVDAPDVKLLSLAFDPFSNLVANRPGGSP